MFPDWHQLTHRMGVRATGFNCTAPYASAAGGSFAAIVPFTATCIVLLYGDAKAHEERLGGADPVEAISSVT